MISIDPLSDILGDIGPLDIPDIGMTGVPGLVSDDPHKDILDIKRHDFATKERDIPRCDFKPGRAVIRMKKPLFVHCLWRRSVLGRTLSEIKADKDMISFFADHLTPFIADLAGHHLAAGGYVLVTPPPRRHLQGNFAQSVGRRIAASIGIGFAPDTFRVKARNRINAVFDVVNMPPQPNVILFDDILTTGSTMQACMRAFQPFNKNILYFAGISNE